MCRTHAFWPLETTLLYYPAVKIPAGFRPAVPRCARRHRPRGVENPRGVGRHGCRKSTNVTLWSLRRSVQTPEREERNRDSYGSFVV